MKNLDDATAATDALQAFVKQFGPMDDIYNRIILEEVLKELLGIAEELTDAPNN